MNRSKLDYDTVESWLDTCPTDCEFITEFERWDDKGVAVIHVEIWPKENDDE
tara:strand:- start:265 stop:420 length:156 start_codon:yes stop_codon:yes gene_type:complete